MTQLWAVQTKLLQEDSARHLVEAFQYLGLNWAAFPFPPLVGQVPDFRWDGPVVYYGSTALVKRVSETPELRAGAALFFDEQTHLPEWYGPRYGKAYLNRDARHTTVREYLRDGTEAEFFARPNDGLKIFGGAVFTRESFTEFVERSEGNALFSFDTKIVVGPKKKIHREFRSWIVDGKVAAAVQYKLGTRKMPDDNVPADLTSFLEEQARVCSPSPVFVLDAAETDEGYEVIEVNCFNSAGFYLTSQILEVVAEVAQYVKRNLKG